MIVLGLGSNLGDREANIRLAVDLLADCSRLLVMKVASFYETEPVGYQDQDSFLNTVVQVKTDLSPRELLKICLDVEMQMGRVREVRWGPRNIDIDLLIYDDVVWDDSELTLPHPRLAERLFVLVPLSEIAAHEAVYQGMQVAELLEQTTDTSQVVKYGSF